MSRVVQLLAWGMGCREWWRVGGPGFAGSVLPTFKAWAPTWLEIHQRSESSRGRATPPVPPQGEFPLSAAPFPPLEARFMTLEGLFPFLGGAAE